MIHPIQRLFVPPLLKLIWIEEIEGMENVPLDGRFIVTPNHQSYIDDWIPPSIIMPLIDKELHMYVNRNYWKHTIARWYLNNHECIPVEVHNTADRKQVNERAFQMALDYLKKNEPVCIYPEGHRSKDGRLQKGKIGAARLALAAKIPVLPFGIIDSIKVLPKGKSFPKLKKIIKVKIGKPIYLDDYYNKKDDFAAFEDATRKIMQGIAKLTNQTYNY